MFREIKPEELKDNAFELIGKEWLLVAASRDGKSNAMTASWGGVGVMWGKPVAFIVLRPQRYTKTFVDSADTFSLGVFPEECRRMMSYMGTVSGRDEDKIAKCGLTESLVEGAPVFEESRLTLVCRKLFAQPMEESSFLQKETVEKWYPEKDFHTLYIAEIEKVLVK
ncbi:MAG: flavin reductase [Eubacteriales bacterium]|nr:flavin reductase [Eubacteriales bacterium]